MSLIAIIGGSGFESLPLLENASAKPVETPYGPPSAPIRRGSIGGQTVLYLARHGDRHQIPPHRVNYRANLWALQREGAVDVVGMGAVGGIGPGFGPGTFAVPDQIIDYTHGRAHTYFDGEPAAVEHIELGEPFCADLRGRLLAACTAAGVGAVDGGTYGATQGPRLETAAEITRLERDGCHLVGMTAMPEAALARELGLCFATLAFVVNWAAGKGSGPIQMADVAASMAACVGRIPGILAALVDAGTADRQVRPSAAQ
jgi:5'-methylthioadenosine phosphorylase/5'-methylthioinosine phosphorylase